MNSHHYSDPIIVLNLSTRPYNVLKKEGVKTINDLLIYPIENIPKLRNLGAKSIDEITNIINELNLYRLEIYSEVKQEKESKTFIGSDGLKYLDIRIEDLTLSVRAYNCLKLEGIFYYSQLADKLLEELINIPNMGRKTLIEIDTLRNSINLLPYIVESEPENPQIEEAKIRLLSAINEKMSIKPRDFFDSFERTHSSYIANNDLVNSLDILLDKSFIKNLYESEYIQSEIDLHILNAIKKNEYGCDEEDLLDTMPEYFAFPKILSASLNSLLADKKIELAYGDKYIALYKSFNDDAFNYMKDKEYEVISKRILGKTLEEVGTEFGVTRERIRQIEAKGLKSLNNLGVKFNEDTYSDIFKRYIISKEDYEIAFKDNTSYYYLGLKYGSNTENKNNSRLPLESIFYDENVPDVLKRVCEKAIYKKYVKIGDEYVICNRTSIGDYVLKTYGQNGLNFEEYSNIYFDVLRDLGKEEDPKLSVMGRGYENKIFNSNNVLCTRKKKFRFYNIDAYDFTDLLDAFNLNQFLNIEISSLKLFRAYPEIMMDYDIRNEYELHNLLKKICSSDDYPTVSFNRMPNIEFGKADRDNQVLELLITLAPISKKDFGHEYEKEYGVAANTLLSDYMINFESYFHNGVYIIDFPVLPSAISEKLKEVLSEDFYMLSEIKDIYSQEFPCSDKDLLNPFTLKSIGFKVFSSYAIRDTYNSATEYFITFLTKNDIVNLQNAPSKMKEILAYSSQLDKLKSDYEIIEFTPSKYISIKKLMEFGITKKILSDYCNDVLDFVGDGKYFTLFSLKEEGFLHELDNLGFEDWFYTSILIEHRPNLSHRRAGGNKIMIKGDFNLQVVEFLEYIVYKQKSLSVDVYDLSDILKNEYNINIERSKLIEITRSSSMHYDAISGKIFADYDTYYKEV